MKLGITAKLFLAVLLTSVLVALAMGVASQASFTRGFLGYLNEQSVERIEELVPGFAAAWREHGDWGFLRGKPRAWFELLRRASRVAQPGSDDAPQKWPPPSDVTGTLLRVALLDEGRRYVAGNADAGADAPMRAIEVDGRTVGWLAAVPFQRATAGADVRFYEGQLRATWAIAGLALLLAAVVALWVAHFLLAPVKRMAEATRRLSAGDYATRVELRSEDEVGRLAADFNRLAQVLEGNERMRRGLMADISHELRTPLAVLRAELEAIEDGVRPLTAQSVRSLQADVHTLAKLVDDLYDLSLSDLGALAYRKEDVDVVATLQQALASFRDRLAERRITLQAALPEHAILLFADPGRMRQLFGNLLENTLRYTDPGGALRVACRRAADTVEIDFEDSTPGVPAELLDRLFERFYRVEGSRSRASGGAGLGLAICRNIVEAHDGRVEATPSPLGGLRIVVKLPASATRKQR